MSLVSEFAIREDHCWVDSIFISFLAILSANLSARLSSGALIVCHVLRSLFLQVIKAWQKHMLGRSGRQLGFAMGLG